MGVRDYLNQIRRMDEAITIRQSQLDDLMTKRVGIRGVSYDSVKVQTSPSGEDPTNNLTEKIVDLEKEIDCKIDQYVDAKMKIIAQIEAMEDRRYSAILAMRYVQYMSFGEIADKLFYEYETVRHYHLDALKAFGEMYAEDVAEFSKNTHNITDI